MKFSLFTIAIVSALACGCGKTTSSSVLGDATHPTLVNVYTVAEETTQRRVQATGSLFPFEESVVSAQVEGRISQVLADVGDNVREGQTLIALDPQELQFEVDRQRGIVRQVRAQLGIGPNDTPRSDPQTLASVQRAEADRFEADQKYKRAREMFEGKLISQQQLDEAASRAQSTKATYDVALQEVDRLKALLVSSEASERLAEKKIARRLHPRAVSRRDQDPRSAPWRICARAKPGDGPGSHRPLASAPGGSGALGWLG